MYRTPAQQNCTYESEVLRYLNHQKQKGLHTSKWKRPNTTKSWKVIKKGNTNLKKGHLWEQLLWGWTPTSCSCHRRQQTCSVKKISMNNFLTHLKKIMAVDPDLHESALIFPSGSSFWMLIRIQEENNEEKTDSTYARKFLIIVILLQCKKK